MTPSQSELEALRLFAKRPLPATKDDWPAYKEANAQAVEIVAAQEASEAHTAMLIEVRKLARRLLTDCEWETLEGRAKQIERLRETIERLNQLTKGE